MIRQKVRQQATRGSVSMAIVEDYHNGLASVRLAANGARLTNVTALGGSLSSGDRVVIDYTGPQPYVRPIYEAEEETLEVELATQRRHVDPEEAVVQGTPGDYSCWVRNYRYDEHYSFILQDDQWHDYRFHDYEFWGYDENPIACGTYEEWDSCNMVNGDMQPAPVEIITIQAEGKYLFNLSIGVSPHVSPESYTDFWTGEPSAVNERVRRASHTHVELYQNDTLVAEATQTALVGYVWRALERDIPMVHIRTILTCAVGDTIRIRIKQAWGINQRYNYMFAEDVMASLQMWRIPRTTQEVKTATYTNPWNGGIDPITGDPIVPPPGWRLTRGRHAHVRGPGDGLHYHDCYLAGQVEQPSVLLAYTRGKLTSASTIDAYIFGALGLYGTAKCYLNGYSDIVYPLSDDDDVPLVDSNLRELRQD